MSDKHLILHRQLQSIVKKEFVDTYGFNEVSSVFGAKTLNVQQLPSTFSTLKTVEQVSLEGCPLQLVCKSLLIGILHPLRQSDT